MPRTVIPYAYPTDVQPFENYRVAAHAGPGFNGFAGWAEFVNGEYPEPVTGFMLRRGLILVVHFWVWVDGARIEWQPDGSPLCVIGEDVPLVLTPRPDLHQEPGTLTITEASIPEAIVLSPRPAPPPARKRKG